MSSQYVLDILVTAEDKATGALSGIGDALGGLGKAAALGFAAAGTAIAGIGAAALGVAQEFEDAQHTLIAATGATGPALDGMGESVVELHGTVAGLGRSMQDIAGVMGEVNTRTGATGPALDAFTEQILKMTHITGDDGVGAVQKITRVMGDWSVPLEESSGLMDKLFGAGQTFGIGLDSLAGKLVQFGAPLRQMGFGLDESIAMLGKWEKEGVNTELVIGSLRIAAGKFAEEQASAGKITIGGVDDMAKSHSQLETLRKKLEIATIKQSEFNEKTKQSTRLSKQMQIDALKSEISDLESAMALGERRTVSSAAANKSLSESLRETFDAIKNASDGTEALNIGMDIFGARAGPDMTAAIREGRFELEDAVKAMEGMGGSIDDVSERSVGLSERWQISMTGLRNSLLPVGNELMALGLEAMPFVEEAAGRMAKLLSATLPGAIGEVREAWAEDWGGIRSTAEETGRGLEIEWIKIRLQAALLVQEMEREFADADITIDWAGIRIPVTEQTQFAVTWEEMWDSALDVSSRGLTNIFGQVRRGLQYMRGLFKYGFSLITGDWAGAWDGWKTAAEAGLDSVLGLVNVWSPKLASLIRGIGELMVNILKAEWEMYIGWFRDNIVVPISKWFSSLSMPAGEPTGVAYDTGGPTRLPRGAQVFNANQSRGLGGGRGGDTITINVYGASDPSATGRAVERGVLSAKRRAGM